MRGVLAKVLLNTRGPNRSNTTNSPLWEVNERWGGPDNTMLSLLRESLGGKEINHGPTRARPDVGMVV